MPQEAPTPDADPSPPTTREAPAGPPPTEQGLFSGLEFSDTIIWIGVVATLIAVLFALNRVLLVRPQLQPAQATRRRAGMLACTAVAIVIAVLALPLEMTSKLGILQLLALAVTALLTLSSTTIAANLMAGLMLGRVRSFKQGDFVRVEEQFGRVSERGLFHVEIQTEARDLVTLPNAWLITRPVRVVRQSGTIVTCELTLGYDLAHGAIEPLLKRAAASAGLEEPYVQILELGDFSVQYRVCGFLKDVKTLLSARSLLRAAVLDTLHGAGVEIVSPSFMNQRQVSESVIPHPNRSRPVSASSPEAIVFDKAERAETLLRRREELGEATESLKSLQSERSGAEGEHLEAIDAKVLELDRVVASLTDEIAALEGERESTDGA